MAARLLHRALRRRAFLGGTAATLLLAACGQAAAPPAKESAPASGAPASGAAPASGSAPATTPAAAAPKTAAGQVVLETTYPAWIIDVNPVINKLSEEYTQKTGVKINVSKHPPDVVQKVLLEAQQKKSTWNGMEGYAAWDTLATWEEGDALAAWDGLIGKEDFDDLLPTARQEMTYKGKVWLFPYRISPIGIGWRPNVYKEVGLPNKPPTTWDEFIEHCEKIEKAKSTPDKRFYGTATILEPRYALYSLIQQLEKDPYDYEKGLMNFSLPQVPRAMELMKKIASYSPAEALRGDTQTAASTGQTGTVFSHLLTMFRSKKPLNNDLLTEALPKLTYSRSNYWSSGPMILKHGGNVEETAKFWLWMSKEKRLYDEMWVINGSPPNRRSVFKQFEPQKGKELDAGIWDVQAQQEESPPMPNSLWFRIQHTIAYRIVQDYAADKIKTPQEAIATINKETDAEIAKQKK
jgi:ABC-type glycerol-3-phosphate transport system substrate-binding protein